MRAARSVAFNLFLALWTLFLGTIFLPIPATRLGRAQRLWARGALAAHRILVGARHEIRGLEHLPSGPGLIAAKHQSAFETIAFITLLRYPVYVLKRELLKIPVYGWYVGRLGHIAIDRSGGAGALRDMMRQARRAADAGGVVIIFPEGTRTEPGRHRAYHPGVAGLQEALDCPVVPVALNSGLSWKKGITAQRPGHIILEVLPPIPPGLPRRELMQRLKSDISAATERLEAEVGPPRTDDGR